MSNVTAMTAMRLYSIVLFCFSLILVSCKIQTSEIKVVKTETYELKIANKQKAVLILFPCFPCDVEHTKAEAGFLTNIEKEGITTLLLNVNRKLYLTEGEKTKYAALINTILDSNNVQKQSVYFGGFSSGGNIALVLSNYLAESKNKIVPKGVFIVDSPLDLEALYNGAKNDLTKNVDAEAVEEAKFLVDFFENELGEPSQNIEKYKHISPFLISCKATNNIMDLKHTKVRFYCEPDLDWQMKYKKRTYEDLNAYKMEKTYDALVELGCTKVDFIKTKNRGIRANGERHPHSWNIVEREGLIKWMLQ